MSVSRGSAGDGLVLQVKLWTVQWSDGRMSVRLSVIGDGWSESERVDDADGMLEIVLQPPERKNKYA